MSIEKKEIFLASRFDEFKELREQIKFKLNNRKTIELIDLNDNNATSHAPLVRSLKNVEKADVMILLLGETYGTIPDGESKSYTHMEYERAKSLNIPILIFCIGKSYSKGYIEYSSDQNLKSWQQELSSTVGMFGDYEDINIIADHIVTNLYNELDEISSTYKVSHENKLIENAIGFLENHCDLKQLSSIVVRYFPRDYIYRLPTTVRSIIVFLIQYGYNGKNIPIICVLEELLSTYKNSQDIKNYVLYLKNEKFNMYECICDKSQTYNEVSFLLEFLEFENDTYTLSVWENRAEEYFKKDIGIDKPFILNDENIQHVFNQLILFLKDSRYSDCSIYLEIILPIEKVLNGLYSWSYTDAVRKKDIKISRKFKYVLRIQERFREQNSLWENKWKKLEMVSCLKESNHVIISEQYNDDITESNLYVYSDTRPNNIDDVIYDINEFNVPVAFLPMDSFNVDRVNSFINNSFKDIKNMICEYIQLNHNNQESKVIFIWDDPLKRPDEFKIPNDFMYGFE